MIRYKNLYPPIFISILISLFFIACETGAGDIADISGTGDAGRGGSFARFMLAGNFMYIVDNENIKTFNLADPAAPVQIDKQNIGEDIETIFRLGSRLFIGSSSGLYLYTIGSDGKPQRQGEYLYSNFDFGFNPCDPVVANDSFAYVTLNTATPITRCFRTEIIETNSLNIFDITDFDNPQLIAQYNMDNPQGVGLDDDLLFLCESVFGLKIFDITDPGNIELIAHIEDITSNDVIPLGGLLLVVGPENVYQIDYTDRNNIYIISQIKIGA